MTKFFVDAWGNYIGGFDGAEPPQGAVEVPSAPQDARLMWTGSAWGHATLDAAKASKLAALAAYCYAREIAGAGEIRTDRESQAKVTGAALAATLDPAYTVDWKGETGWVTLNATQLLAAAQAVRAHVQACYSNERAHAEAISALGSAEAVAGYDFTTGWP